MLCKWLAHLITGSFTVMVDLGFKMTAKIVCLFWLILYKDCCVLNKFRFGVNRHTDFDAIGL